MSTTDLEKWGGFPELTLAQNQLIWDARNKGFATFWPSFPDAKTQALKTLAGATEYLDGLES